jgi:hypothetical protein
MTWISYCRWDTSEELPLSCQLQRGARVRWRSARYPPNCYYLWKKGDLVFFRTLTSLDTRQGTGALLSGFPSQESLQILDDDDENESEFLYPVERVRRATTGVPYEQTQGAEELEHDATLSEPEDPEQLLPVGREEFEFQPLVEKIRRTTSLSPAYQNELLPFQQTHRNTTVSLAEEGEPAFSPSAERSRRAATGLAAEQQQATVATEQDVVSPESVSRQQSLVGKEEDSEFPPPVQRIRRMTTVAPAERQQSTLQRRHIEFLPEPEITSEPSPSDEDEPESRLQPVRRTTTAPPGVQQPMIEPELDSSAEVDSRPPVGRIRRSTTVQPAIQRQVTVEPGADALLVELGFNGAFPVIDEVTELQPAPRSIRGSTVSPIQQMAGAYPGTPTSKSGSQEGTSIVEEESEFQLPVERIRQETDMQSVGRREESRIASPVIEEPGLEVSIERIRGTTTVQPAFQLQDSFKSTSESSTSSPVDSDRSAEAEFQFPIERVRRTTTLQPGEQLQESRTGSLVPKDGFEFQMPVERIRRTTTVESSGKRQDSFKSASVSSETSPVAEEVLEQPVSSRAASRQPTFQARRKSTMPLATDSHHLARSISSPVIGDLAEGPSVSRVVSRQPTQTSRTNTMLSAVPRNDSVELDRSPSLSLPKEGEPYQAFSRQPTRRVTIRETEAKALSSFEIPLEIEDVPDQITLSRSASHQPTLREDVLAVSETQQSSLGEAEGILAEPQVDARHLDHPFRRQTTDLADTTLKERLTLGGRTTTTRVPSRTESLAYQGPEYSKEVLLDDSTELESKDVLESTHGFDRKEETDQVEKARTTDLASDTESFGPPIYQRIAEEPPDEGNDSRGQSKAGSPEVYGSEDLIGQSERAPTNHFNPTLAPIAHTDAEDQLDPDVHFERRVTQASQEFQASIPRILTIPNGSNRKRSSDAGNIISSATGFGPVVSTEVESQRNESPQVARRKTQLPSEPRTTDRRRSSAAPGITAPPPEMISEQMKVGMQSRSPKQKPKKGANYSPEQQYPPAPAYPLRETPSWTKPDTRTPSPKPKVESPPKKRGWLGLGPWPKEELLESEVESQSRRPSQPALNSSSVQPFRGAAPGSPEVPGGTQKRQNSYPSHPRQSVYRRKSDAVPLRRADTRSRQTSVYAHKDDYYPITPILPDRVDDDTRPQSSPSRRTSYSVRRTASTNETFRQDEPKRQSTRRLSSGLSQRESRPQQALRTRPDVSTRSQAPEFQTRRDTEVEVSRTAQGSDKEEVQSPVRRDVRRPTKTGTSMAKEETSPREGTQSPETRRNLSQVPRKKVRQMKESRVDRQAGCWKCLVLKRRKSKRESQQDDQRLKERSTIALESKRRWSWTPKPRKAKKTTPSAVASIDRVSSPSMTTPDLPAQLTSRVQEHHQNRPPEMKATKEGLQHQMQEKRRPLRENTSVDQPQHERETSRPSSLQRRIQRSPHEGFHHQSRERKHDAGLQQLGKIERRSRREHPQSPEHQRERQQSHRVPDKQIVEDNPPPRERVHQSRARPYSTAKRNQSKQEELNHHNSKKNEVQPRQPRHKQIEGHLLRPERIWRYPERLYQDQRQQEKEGTDLLRQSHKDPSVQSRQFQHPTQGPVNPGHSQRKVHWQRSSQPTEAQSSKPSQAREQI